MFLHGENSEDATCIKNLDLHAKRKNEMHSREVAENFVYWGIITSLAMSREYGKCDDERGGSNDTSSTITKKITLKKIHRLSDVIGID